MAMTDEQLEKVIQELRQMSQEQLHKVVFESLCRVKAVVPCAVWQFLDSLDSDMYNRH